MLGIYNPSYPINGYCETLRGQILEIEQDLNDPNNWLVFEPGTGKDEFFTTRKSSIEIIHES